MSELPKDPFMLLSFVNTNLRDFYPSLESFCEKFQISSEDLQKQLEAIDYKYDSSLNKFI